MLLNNLTFDVFSKYNVSRKRLKSSLKKKRKRNEADNDGKVSIVADPGDDMLLYYRKRFYDTIRCSIAHLFRIGGIKQSEELRFKMSSFTCGLKRTIAVEKREVGLKLGEGKDKMGFETYQKIAELLFKAGGSENIFAHCFLVLEWNLMARADNIVYTNISHTEWQGDSLVFYFARTKGDQEGINEKAP